MSVIYTAYDVTPSRDQLLYTVSASAALRINPILKRCRENRDVVNAFKSARRRRRRRSV